MSNTLDIRRFPLIGSQLIEASAGTGKTFTIALLYTRLILQHGGEAAFHRALNPEEVLVVTFTDAATQELKDRIRARLADAARCFLSPADTDDPLLVALRNDYEQALWPNCARLLTLAAQSMDQAAVSTIHGWCYRMLREHAFDSGSLFQQTLITNQQDILAALIRDYWRQQFYALPSASAAQVQKAFRDPAVLLRSVRPLINKTNAVLTYNGHIQQPCVDLAAALTPFADSVQQLQVLEEQARQLWHDNVEELNSLLDEYRPYLNKNSYAEMKQDDTHAGLKKSLWLWATGEDYDKLKRFAQGNWRLVKNSPAPPEHPALSAIYALITAREELDDHQGPDLRTAVLNHARCWLENALQARLLEKAEFGYDDLLLQLDKALQGPMGDRLANRIRLDYPVAMIDEFQDTDPLQYRIFDRIYQLAAQRKDSALLMIGDPKQAIYSFRNADIHTYLTARSATAGRHYSLDTNFRSTQGVVAAVNHIFEHAEQFPGGAFRFASGPDNPLPFAPVNANGRKDTLILNNKTATPLTFWLYNDHDDNSRHSVTVSNYRARMAELCARQIAVYLRAGAACRFEHDNPAVAARKLLPRDIAILVRKRDEADVVRAELNRLGLASVYLSDRESVFTTPEAGDVLRWLHACAEPGDERKVRAALGTRALALDFEHLARLHQDELLWEEQTDLFRQLKLFWQSQGVLAMLRHLMQSQHLSQRLRTQPNGERSLTNLLHLAEYLQKASVHCEGEQALIRHLAEQIDSPDDEEVLRLESDDDLIRVVTIHKSKGLEYPLVFLPFIADWRPVDHNTRQVSVPVSGNSLQRHLEVAGQKVAAGAWLQADEERVAEDTRLLYVAMTRATHGLWLGVAPLSKGTSPKPMLQRSALGCLLSDADTIDGITLQETLGKMATANPHIDLLLMSALNQFLSVGVNAGDNPLPLTTTPFSRDASTFRPALRSARSPAEHWWIASYSSLKSGAAEPEQATDDQILEEQTVSHLVRVASGDDPRHQFNRTADGLHGFHRGPKPGTFLHNLLEWAAEYGFQRACDDADARRNIIAQRCGQQAWPDDVDRLDTWLPQFLATRFVLHDNSSLKLCDMDSYQAELEFLFASASVNSTSIDQLCRRHLMPGHDRPALKPVRLNGMVKGFIDLVFSHQGRYYVADWKSNYLGPDSTCYTREAIREEILHTRYDVQYAIYLLALHRLLRSRLPDYDYDHHVGGAVYVFLRGWQADSQGVLSDRPSRECIEELDALFAGRTQTSAPQQLDLISAGQATR